MTSINIQEYFAKYLQAEVKERLEMNLEMLDYLERLPESERQAIVEAIKQERLNRANSIRQELSEIENQIA